MGAVSYRYSCRTHFTNSKKRTMSVYVALHLTIKDGQAAALKEAMKKVIPEMKSRDGCAGVKPLVARDGKSALIMSEFTDAAKFDAAMANAKSSGKFEQMKGKLEQFATVRTQTYSLGAV